jgi:hypothetical protein
MNKHPLQLGQLLDRRQFLTRTSLGLGAIAVGGLLGNTTTGGPPAGQQVIDKVVSIHPKVKRVVYMFQSGGPSQLDLFDYKPLLREYHGQDLPDSVRKGQRLTGMSGQQSSFPMTASIYDFRQYGESQTWVSELMPHTARIVDDLCFIRSMHTEAINHDPAITFFQTGSMLPGRPSIGAWVSYGLGSDNDNLPAFIVLVSKNAGGQPLYARLWGNGFLPTEHQGVQFRSGKDPVLFLRDPEGFGTEDRAAMLRHLRSLNELQYDTYQDPEIRARMAQYEMAFRMQTSVPEVMDMSSEPDYIYDLYGPDSRDPGTYAANCLLARKLLERNVKFVQLYHQGWDQHLNLPAGIESQCRKTDQATAALVQDLKQRGMLEDTLVIWGGEFGRTVYSQGKLTATNYGRDHHPRCFTMWMAGAGVRAGYAHGITDDFGYNIVQDPVHVHDFQATLLHLMGVNHEELTFRYQGRRFRLTDVHGQVIPEILV